MKNRCVLIVEDNPDNRAIFSAILNHFGYSVLEAGDGERGVALARSAHPDVILMDISLPKMDGYEAISLLKSESGTAEIPIIAVTAHAMREDERRAFAAGCDDYLPKPVEPLTIVKTVERHINGSDAAGRAAS